MYCRYFGVQCEKTLFYPDNGTSVTTKNTEATKSANKNGTANSAEKNLLKSAYDYFALKTNEYTEYDNLFQKALETYKMKLIPLLVWGIVIIVASIFFYFFNDSFKGNVELQKIVVIINVIGGSVMIIFFIINAATKKNRILKYITRINDITNSLRIHYTDYDKCMVGMEFTNPNNLNAIIMMIESGKANSVKEALNNLCDINRRKINDENNNRVLIDNIMSEYGYRLSVLLYSAKLFNYYKMI